jgi:quercetin dioxygenase-like cupin family protein
LTRERFSAANAAMLLTRRDVAIAALAVLATATVAGVAHSSSPSKPIQRSSVFGWAGFKAEPTKTGSRRECLDVHTATLERLEVHVTTLNPGESPHPAHKHPEEELVIVKEGVLEAAQNDTTNRVEAGGLIFEASNEMHGLRNPGTKPAVYYVVKWFPAEAAKTR